MENYRAEKDLLDLHAENHESKFKAVDKEMQDLIARKSSGHTKELLQ